MNKYKKLLITNNSLDEVIRSKVITAGLFETYEIAREISDADIVFFISQNRKDA